MAQYDSYSSPVEPQDSWQTLFSDGAQLKNVSAQKLFDYINGKIDIETLVSNELDSRGIDQTAKEAAIPLISKDGSGNVSYAANFNLYSTNGFQTLGFPIPSGYKVIPYNHILYWNTDSGLDSDQHSPNNNLKLNLRWIEGGSTLDFAASNAPTNLVDGSSQWININQWYDGLRSIMWFYGNRKGNEDDSGVMVFADETFLFSAASELQIACEQNVFPDQSTFESNLNNGSELVLRVKYYEFNTNRISA